MATDKNSDDRIEGTSSTIIVNGEEVDLEAQPEEGDLHGTAVIHRLAAENREKIPFGNDATVATPGLGGPTAEFYGSAVVRPENVEVLTPAEQQVEALQPENLPALTESQVEESKLALEEAEERAAVEREYADAHDGVLGPGPVAVPDSVARDHADSDEVNSAAARVEAPNAKTEDVVDTKKAAAKKSSAAKK